MSFTPRDRSLRSRSRGGAEMGEFLHAVLHPERARPARPGWLSAVGLVLVPLLIGGLLVWSLWQPDERLDRIQAAVVNQDEPVEVQDQTVPLGRQLAAALVTAGGAEATAGASGSNFTWVVTSADDAAAGLGDGRYATVVTIPADFSAAATSSGTDPANARRATIDIATSERSRPVDAAVSQVVTSTAVRVLSSQLTTTYLENLFVGFDTLRGHLGDAADGAAQLASGATQVGDGATALASGAGELASGADQLASGASSLASGAASLSSGVGRLASGTSSLASGLDQLAAGTSAAAAEARAGAPGAQELAAGLDQLAAGVTVGTGGQPALAGVAAGTADGAQALAANLPAALGTLQTLAVACASDASQCPALQAALGQLADPASPASLVGAANRVAQGASGIDAALNGGAPGRPAIADSLTALAAGGHRLADGVSSSAAGLDQLAGAIGQSAAAAHQLADGAEASAAGASQLSSGVSSLASGARQSADGVGELATGAAGLATGAAELGGGAGDLADGLGTAADQVPAYSSDEADRLAEVVAEPVAATGAGGGLFGEAGIPFVLVVALWLGGLATFLVLGATAPRAVGSTRSPLRLALTASVPGAAVGLVQGLALTAAMARALDLTAGGWAAFAAVAALAGVAFAAVNQGLVAAFRGIGRFVAVVVAVVGLATAVVSTTPRLLDAVDGALPLAAARDAMLGVVTGSGVGGAVVLLVLWTAVGLGLTTAAIARRRVVPAGQLARWARAA